MNFLKRESYTVVDADRRADSYGIYINKTMTGEKLYLLKFWPKRVSRRDMVAA